MSLKDVEKNLYRREEEEGGEKPLSFGGPNPLEAEESPFTPAVFSAKKEEKNAVWIKEAEEKKWERRKKIKKIALVSAVVLMAGAVLIWAVMAIRKSAFSGDQVKVSISGPEKVQSGDLVSFEIDYQNLNRASLRDAILHINYPENFKPSGNLGFESDGPNNQKYNVGAVDGNTGGKITFSGKFFGPKDLLVYADVSLEYSSSNFSSHFKAEDKTGIFISSSPLQLEISGPQNAVAGSSVTYKIKYQNNGQEEMQGLKIKVDYPDGFAYASSSPLPTEGNNVWYVGNLGAGQSGEVGFAGNVSGLDGEIRKFKAAIGEFGNGGDFVAYNETEGNSKIIASPLVVEQTINGAKDKININAGDVLNFRIKYSNTGTVGLRDVILTEEIKSPILDYAQTNMAGSGGSLDAKTGLITWRAADIPKLKIVNPGDSGEVSFFVPVKSVIPVAGTEDKKFSFDAVAKMDSPDVPTSEGTSKIISSNSINVKLNSKLAVAVQGFYNDPEIKNSGPLPLVVGTETTFTMHLKLMNVSNDLSNAAVSVAFPPGVKWKNTYSPQNATVEFNDRASQLVWNIGKMPAGIGVITGPQELIFQIGVVPGADQAGGFIQLLGKTVFSAADTFTGQKLEVSLDGKNSNLTEDISVGNGGMVAK